MHYVKYTTKNVHFMDVSYTHEMYVFKMSHFLRTVCIKYTRHEVLIFKKKLTVIIFCNEQIFFFYLFLEYLILHYETAVVVLRHSEIVMYCVIIKYMMDIKGPYMG